VLKELNFYYLLKAQRSIIQTGNQTHQVEPGEATVKGNFYLEIPVEFSMSPLAKMLIYSILPDGDVIADSLNFEIEKCLRNKVDLRFSTSQIIHASKNRMQVTAS
ncbi:hypothetical protein NP569_24005, partial [Vibrio parahaemolyticus]|nr:hypothetical protein [Vibrio parahaemolyticus]